MRTSCLVCGREGRFWTRKADRDIWRCAECGLVWIPEGLVVTDRGTTIYEGDEPIFLQDGNEQYYLDETNLISAQAKLAWIARHAAPGGALLDVGSNFGHFLSAAQERFTAVGVELSRAAVEWGREHFGVESHVGSIYDLPTEVARAHDVVTLFDVIEHVPEPRAALTALREALHKDGILALSTPDAGSLAARVLGSRWHYLDPIQHIVLFNRRNLTTLLEASGFEVLEVRSLGHHYRLGYIADRLAYLHDTGVLGRVTKLGQAIAHPVAKASVAINLGDVMGIIARAR